MTLIVGLSIKTSKGRKVYACSDSGIYYGDDTGEFGISPKPKIIKKTFNNGEDQFIMGNSGSMRTGDILESLDYNHLKVLKKYKKNPRDFIVDKLIPYIKSKLKDDDDFEILICLYGQVFCIDGEFAVLDAPSYGLAIGICSLPAKAALIALEKVHKGKKVNHKKLLKTVMQSVELCSTFCRPPYIILEL